MFFKFESQVPSATKAIFSMLQSIKIDNFKQSDAINLLDRPSAPSAWIYFAEKNGDCGFEADGYRWRNKSLKQEDAVHHYARYYILLPPLPGQKKAIDEKKAIDSQKKKKLTINLNLEMLLN